MQELAKIVAGPITRHIETQQLSFWLVTTEACQWSLTLTDEENNVYLSRHLSAHEIKQVQVGKFAFISLLSVKLEAALPENTKLYYDLRLCSDTGEQPVTELVEGLTYPGESLPSFVINSKITKLLHGSCRKPHHDSEDGLIQVDNEIAKSVANKQVRPSLLMMSGDQIYADDVAGPMLVAIHQVINLLGLFDESWQGAVVNDSQGLFNSELCYYQREQLLPHDKINKAVYDKIFAATKKPIFTSVNAKNHLVTLSEVLAMYFLTWSPELWKSVKLDQHKVPDRFAKQYQAEVGIINHFSDGLTSVRRALAHIPVYMIFDDHDVTDDWNLTRGWEEAAYGHEFSKRIIGNALAGYWLCQGWGNAPDKFTTLDEQAKTIFTGQGLLNHDEFIDALLAWQNWHYHLDTSPKVVVLDTRTRRWRSESNAGKPSGLMDWEALSEMQQELINQKEIILVSPAPIYGVKMIETIQRVFTFFGQPLMVDAENWMAHSGTANVMLNIFKHQKTPPEFIILSGDVHYSFVYEVTHRFRRNSSKIIQITCSGIKNEFPPGLLRWLERLNRYLYSVYSPLNWFTKRRHMKVVARKPTGHKKSSLYNGSGIGELTLIDGDDIVKADVLNTHNERISFEPKVEKE